MDGAYRTCTGYPSALRRLRHAGDLVLEQCGDLTDGLDLAIDHDHRSGALTVLTMLVPCCLLRLLEFNGCDGQRVRSSCERCGRQHRLLWYNDTRRDLHGDVGSIRGGAIGHGG